jgi:hypothetical protein
MDLLLPVPERKLDWAPAALMTPVLDLTPIPAEADESNDEILPVWVIALIAVAIAGMLLTCRRKTLPALVGVLTSEGMPDSP